MVKGAMRSVIQYPNPILNSRSVSVDKVDHELRSVIDDMVHYASQPNCSGISAIQLGKPSRIIAVRQSTVQVIVVVNPLIVKMYGTYSSIEGCLSIEQGKKLYRVNRYKQVKVAGLNPNGEPVSYKARDLFGAALQHEVDHLDGILINSKGVELSPTGN